MDRKRIKKNYVEISQALPKVKIAYAIKSNSDQEIVKILKNENSFFETASLAEIQYLLSLGVSPKQILYSNPVKSLSAIEQSISLGVQRTTFDSLEEAQKLLPFQKDLKLFLRIIVSNEGSMWPLVGKFGLGKTLWQKTFSFLQKHNMPLYGISFHVGSQCESLSTWDNAMQTAWQAFTLAKEFGLYPVALNIGGGFPIFLGNPIPTIFEIGNIINQHLEQWQKQGLVLEEIFAEPGRFISGSAGFLKTKVIGVANRELNGKYKKWVYLDTGVFSGLMETIDGISYPMKSSGSGELEEVQLCGPSCDSVDKMFMAKLPQPKEGDVLYLLGAGAYTTVYASNFNGFAMPQVTWIDSSKDFFKKRFPLQNEHTFQDLQT